MRISIKPIHWNTLILCIGFLTQKADASKVSYTDDTSRKNIALGKPTKQSSTNGAGTSSRAVDGNKSLLFKDGSCTLTNKEANPWWNVDLEKEYVIDKIKITNRGDGFGYRLRGMSILVGNSKADSINDNQICVKDQSLFDGETKQFSCTNNPKGRYVYITIKRTIRNPDETKKSTQPRTNADWTLTLCEVQVFAVRNINYDVNVALLKLSKQTSTDTYYEPTNAIDGWDETCSITKKENKPWWRVDLIVPFYVASVKIVACYGSPGTEYHQVLLGNIDDINDSSNKECTKSTEDSTEYFCPKESSYRFVFVRLTKQGALGLGSVKVSVAERVISDDGCREKRIGGNGDISDIRIPPRILFTSTTVDHWENGDTTGYEVFGTRVYISEVIDGLIQSNHKPDENDKETKVYRLRIRADTFYCSKQEQKDGNPYMLHGFEKIEIIVRLIVGDGCEIHLTQVNRNIEEEKIINTKAGAPGYKNGRDGGDGADGENGLEGRGVAVVISYIESRGKISMRSKGGNGGNGHRGHDGGNGFKGEKGEHAPKVDCEARKGGVGGKGGNGGNGGRGGNGGNGGHGGIWIFLTPGNSERDIQFSLRGCPGDPGPDARGGDGGKGGEGGDGGEGYSIEKKWSNYGHFYYCTWGTGERGPIGQHGENGRRAVDGARGKEGVSGVYVLKNINKNVYDEDLAEVILKSGDELYMKGKTQKALQLYKFIHSFVKPGKSKKYSKLMIDKIMAGLNYYGFTDQFMMAIDVAKSDFNAKKAMTRAKEENARIDKKLYREFINKKTTIQFLNLVEALKENNKGIQRETEANINFWKIQRGSIVTNISTIEGIMKNFIADIRNKLDAAQKLLERKTLLEFLQICTQYIKPDKPDLQDIFETVIDITEEANDCGHTYNHEAMSSLMETALSFNEFSGNSYNWDTLDISKLKPEAAAEMSKVLTKDKVGALEESFACLFENGIEGLQLSGAIGTYLDYALSRLTFIGELYKIDIKLAEYRIRLDALEKTNKNMENIKKNTKSRTSQVILNKVAITEELINSFEETTKDVLELIYIQTESLRFVTLWDFNACMSCYSPNYFIKSGTQTYFDGFKSLAYLRDRIQKYRRNYILSRDALNAQESLIQKWIYEFKDKDSKAIKNLKKGEAAHFYINQSEFRSDGDTNVRLHKLYAELIFTKGKEPKLKRMFINIEHMGDNHFHVNSVGEDELIMMYQKPEGRKIKSRVKKQCLESCGAHKSCLGEESYPPGLLLDICDVSPVKEVQKRASSGRLKKLPCRSPFATYRVRIPIGKEDRMMTSTNPSSIDLSGIIGLRFLIGITFWEDYPKSKPRCVEN